LTVLIDEVGNVVGLTIRPTPAHELPDFIVGFPQVLEAQVSEKSDLDCFDRVHFIVKQSNALRNITLGEFRRETTNRDGLLATIRRRPTNQSLQFCKCSLHHTCL